MGRDTPIVLSARNVGRLPVNLPLPAVCYRANPLTGSNPGTGEELVLGDVLVKPTEDDVLGAKVLLDLDPIPEQALTDSTGTQNGSGPRSSTQAEKHRDNRHRPGRSVRTKQGV